MTKSTNLHSRTPHGPRKPLPNRASAISLYLSGPSLSTAAFGSMIAGSGSPGPTRSTMPCTRYFAILRPMSSFTSRFSNDGWFASQDLR